MHIFDIWLDEIKIFAPSNLKKLCAGIVYNLIAILRYLLIDWWWFSLLILLSHIIIVGLISMVVHPGMSSALILLLEGLLLAAKAFYGFLAVLAAFPTQTEKPQSYFLSRQFLMWPIITPFVLWEFFSWHFFKFFCILFNCQVVGFAKLVASYLLLVQIDWFASSFFVFFAFSILATHAMHGILYSLEHAALLFLYTYPVSAIIFALLYLIAYALNYFVVFLATINIWFGLAFNPIVILIPLSAVLFGAVYQWHMKLGDDYQ